MAWLTRLDRYDYESQKNALSTPLLAFILSATSSFAAVRGDKRTALRPMPEHDITTRDIFNAYHGRVIARLEDVIADLEGGINHLDITKNETLMPDRSEQPWAKTQAGLTIGSQFQVAK